MSIPLSVTKSGWLIDPVHSEVHFKVKHLVIATITGAFRTFEGVLHQAGESWEGARVAFSLEVDSLDTAHALRDEHLKSDLFFDAPNHPRINFASTAFTQAGEQAYKLTGDLTIRGITHPITLDVVYGGTTAFRGLTKAGFAVEGKLSRQAFGLGLTWNMTSETGGLVVGDEIKLLMNVELIKQ